MQKYPLDYYVETCCISDIYKKSDNITHQQSMRKTRSCTFKIAGSIWDQTHIAFLTWKCIFIDLNQLRIIRWNYNVLYINLC
jgi:hypothetical protein